MEVEKKIEATSNSSGLGLYLCLRGCSGAEYRYGKGCLHWGL